MPSSARRATTSFGHEAPGGGELLDDGVARVLEDELERVVDLGARPVVAVRDLGERGGDVPRREPRGDRAHALGVRREVAHEVGEELGLARATRAPRRARACRRASSSSSHVKRSPVATVCLRRHSVGALATCARVTSMYQPKTRV